MSVAAPKSAKSPGHYLGLTKNSLTGRTCLLSINADTTPSAFKDGSHSIKAGTESPFGPGNVVFSSTIVGSKIQGPRRGGRGQGMIVKGRTVIVSGAGSGPGPEGPTHLGGSGGIGRRKLIPTRLRSSKDKLTWSRWDIGWLGSATPRKVMD